MSPCVHVYNVMRAYHAKFKMETVSICRRA